MYRDFFFPFVFSRASFVSFGLMKHGFRSTENAKHEYENQYQYHQRQFIIFHTFFYDVIFGIIILQQINVCRQQSFPGTERQQICTVRFVFDFQ